MFGCIRVVWNDALAFCRSAEKLPGYNQLSALLTQSKKTEQRQWLKDVSSVPLQQSLRHLDVAYRNFFNSRNGKHQGKKSGLPKFKKKTNNQTAEFTKAAFSVSGEYVYLAKIGDISPVKVFLIQALLVSLELQRSSREKLGNSRSKLRSATVAVLFDLRVIGIMVESIYN